MNTILRCYIGHELEYGTQQPGKGTYVDGFGGEWQHWDPVYILYTMIL